MKGAWNKEQPQITTRMIIKIASDRGGLLLFCEVLIYIDTSHENNHEAGPH